MSIYRRMSAEKPTAHSLDQWVREQEHLGKQMVHLATDFPCGRHRPFPAEAGMSHTHDDCGDDGLAVTVMTTTVMLRGGSGAVSDDRQGDGDGTFSNNAACV